eukprot:4478017-Prymnesium_polylepis.1
MDTKGSVTLRCNPMRDAALLAARALLRHLPSFSRRTLHLLRRALRDAGLMRPKRSSRRASLK